jgi:hypothetical protein
VARLKRDSWTIVPDRYAADPALGNGPAERGPRRPGPTRNSLSGPGTQIRAIQQAT